MRHYKVVTDGIILAVGTGNGGTEIAESEYNRITSFANSCPTAQEGYAYRLTEALTWELYERPVSTEQDIAAEADYLAALERFGVK